MAVTLDPAAISFGPVATSADQSQSHPHQCERRDGHAFHHRAADHQRFQRARHREPEQRDAAGGTGSQQITVSLTGSQPARRRLRRLHRRQGRRSRPASALLLRGGQTACRTTSSRCRTARSSGVPNDYGWLLLFRVVDQFGVPVANTPVSFKSWRAAASSTRRAAIRPPTGWATAGVFVDLGPHAGSDQIFTGTAGGLTQSFDGYARRLPTIKTGGVVNAGASLAVGQGLAAGILHLDLRQRSCRRYAGRDHAFAAGLARAGRRELRRRRHESARALPLHQPGTDQRADSRGSSRDSRRSR